MPHLHRAKGLPVPTRPFPPSLPSPHRKTSIHLREVRSFLLLLLLGYAAILILRFVLPHPAYSVVESETGEVFYSTADSLKTHVSSTTELLEVYEENNSTSPESSIECSSIINGAAKVESNQGFLCCDRSHIRTDVCYMKGDIRTDSPSSSIILYNSPSTQEELIRPYTRKWETSVMNTIDEIRLRPGNGSKCDFRHNVSAVVFSMGGYTGNLFHDFNDGLLPLYITGERFGGEVVLVVLEYHGWWVDRYEGMMKKLSKYEVVDFKRDQRVHCFKEMIIGLKIHGDLTIDQSLGTGKGIRDFQTLFGEGLLGSSQTEQKQQVGNTKQRPKLVMIDRNKSRMILNMRQLLKTCQRIGFEVYTLNPKRTTQLAYIYSLLNTANVMMGVHGAAMTHFLFMRPGSVLIQIVPLGVNWAAEEYYGAPAKKLGLEYMEYKISAEESSLSEEYDQNDPVLVDPASVNSKGWSETKRIYLEKQNVTVNMKRFDGLLKKAYTHVKSGSLHQKN